MPSVVRRKQSLVVLKKQGNLSRGSHPNLLRQGPAALRQGSARGLEKRGASISGAFNQAVEAAKKKLKPADAAVLDKTLKANKGEVRAVVIPAGAGTKALSAISLPKGVVLAAVQRGDAIQTTDPSFVLVSGDTVYLVGETTLLDEATKVIGG